MLERKIHYFIDVVQEGSFSSAAKKYLLSQSAISQQITQLENEIGVILFDRSGYKPKLTNQGKVFYEGCLKLQRETDELLESIQLEHIKIRIGLTQLEQNKHLIKIINQFKNHYKNVEFDLIEGTFEETNTNLLQSKTDLAFGLESDFKSDEEIEYKPLFHYTMCLMCSLNNPLALKDEISVEDLKNQNYICLSKKMGRNFYRDFIQAFKLDGIKPKIIKEVDTFEQLTIDVSLDKGVAICSSEVVNENIAKAIPIIDTHHHNDYVIAYHKDCSEIEQRFIKETIHYFETL
nr:LysR family transcriptional regulator [uncultured Faecalibacillus sp.]